MATKKTTSSEPVTLSKTKATTGSTNTPASKELPSTQSNERQSQFATILIGLLIIAGGLLIYNYFQQPPATTSEQVASQVSPTPTLASTQTPTPAATVTPTAAFTPTPTPVPTKTNAKPTPTPTPGTTSSYTVQAGDSAWSVAEKVYGDGFQYRKIVQANHLPTDTQGRPVVEVGQVLTVPGTTSTTTVQPSGTGAATSTHLASTHIIQHGETLWTIAEDAYGKGTDWILIYNDTRNHLSLLPDGKPLIHAGNLLYLPAAP